MSKKIEITLSDIMVDRINSILIHRRDDTFQSLIVALVNQGATQLEYHYKRNKTQWKEVKEMKSKLSVAERELAELRAQIANDEVVARD